MIRTLSPVRLISVNAGNTAPRSGATLVEVLMALLIMSVGIVSVFSLFPVAIVASIRATQLTNGKIFVDNIGELLHTVPELMRPPIGEPWQATQTWRGNWQPFESYEVDDIIFPTVQNGKLFPQPYFALRCSDAGRSGALEPDWNYSTFQYPNDGDVAWQAIRMPNFVVDPLGFHRSSAERPLVFGNRDLISGTDNTLIAQLPRRTPGPVNNERMMTRLFASPDSWSVVFEEIPLDISSGTTIQFPETTDVGSISNDVDFPFTRVVLTTPDGTHSIVRYPTSSSAGRNLTVTESIPAAFTGPARLETFSSRYSCFLTVSNIQLSDSGAAQDIDVKESFPPPKVSVAVMFNRQLSSDIEHTYRAKFGNGSYDLDGNQINEDQVKISWTAGSEPEPYLKVGSYILDAKHLVFYRIVAITKSEGSATVTVDHSIENTHKTTSREDSGLAILMPGIIHVYTLEGAE